MKHDPDFYKLTAENFRRMEDAEVYFMRFKGRAGWAMAIIHEPTGTVAIHSDYGDWTFSWPQPGRGTPTLKEFICDRGGFDYLAGKFEQGQEDEFDFDKTVLDIKDRIAEAADESPITWNDDIVHELNEWLDEEAPSDIREFIDAMPPKLYALLGDEPWEHVSYDKRPAYYWLRDGILPALVEELRKTMPVKEEANQ